MAPKSKPKPPTKKAAAKSKPTTTTSKRTTKKKVEEEEEEEEVVDSSEDDKMDTSSEEEEEEKPKKKTRQTTPTKKVVSKKAAAPVKKSTENGNSNTTPTKGTKKKVNAPSKQTTPTKRRGGNSKIDLEEEEEKEDDDTQMNSDNNHSESEDEENESEEEEYNSSEDEKKKKKKSTSKKQTTTKGKKTSTKKRSPATSKEDTEEEEESSDEELPPPRKPTSKPSSQTKTSSQKFSNIQKKPQNELKPFNSARLSDPNYISPSIKQDKLIKRLKKFEEYISRELYGKVEELEVLSRSLVDPKLLNNQDSEIKLLVACCLIELFRIHSPEVPFEDENNQTRLSVLEVFTFELFGINQINESLFPQYYSLIERLASVKVYSILGSIDSEVVPEFIKSVLDLMLDEGIPSSLVPLYQSIITDTIESLEEIPVAIWDTLMSVLLEDTVSSLQARDGESSDRVKVVRGVLLHHIAFLKPHLKLYIRALSAPDTSSLRNRRNEVIYSLYTLSPDLLDTSAILDMGADLHSEDTRTRRKAVMILTRMFADQSEMDEDFGELFTRLIRRFEDIEVKIRLIMLEFANVYPVDAAYSAMVKDKVVLRLKDKESVVRAAAVKAFADYMVNCPKLVSSKDMESMYSRTRDLETTVRKDAVMALSTTWNVLRDKHGPIPDWSSHLKECFGEIPNTLFACFGLQDHDRFRAEVAIDTVLLSKFQDPEQRTSMLMELYSYLDSRTKDCFFTYLERKRLLQRDFLALVDCIENHPNDKELLDRCMAYLDNNIPKYTHERTKTVLKNLLLTSNKKILGLLKSICDVNTTIQEQYNTKLVILSKASTDSAFSDLIKFFVYILSFGLIGKENIQYILEDIKNDMKKIGTEYDEKVYLKDSKSIPESIELLSRVSKIFPSLFESYGDEMVPFLFTSRTIANEFLHLIYNVVDHLKFSKSSLKKLQNVLINLCEIGSPKVVKMAFRVLNKIITDKKNLKNIITDLGEGLVQTIDNQPKNIISSLITLGLIARTHHDALDKECYDRIEIIVYKKIMSGTCKAELNIKAMGKLDYAYSKEVLLKMYGIYYLSNYLDGLPEKTITKMAFEIATYIYDFLFLADRTRKYSQVEQLHIKLFANIECIRLLNKYPFILCFQPVHYLSFCNVAMIRSELKADALQYRFFHKLDKNVRLNRISLRFMAAFGLTASQPANLMSSIKREVSSIIKMRRMAISRLGPKLQLRGETYPEHSFAYFIYLLAHRPGVEEEYPTYEETSRYFKYFTNMLIEEKDNYAILMGYLEHISQTIDQLDPYSKNVRRVAKHCIQILTEEYKDKKWKVQKYPATMALPSSFFIYYKDLDFTEYDNDTSDKLPTFYMVTQGRGSDRLEEAEQLQKELAEEEEKKKNGKEVKKKDKDNDEEQSSSSSEDEKSPFKKPNTPIKPTTKKQAAKNNKRKKSDEEEEDQDNQVEDKEKDTKQDSEEVVKKTRGRPKKVKPSTKSDDKAEKEEEEETKDEDGDDEMDDVEEEKEEKKTRGRPRKVAQKKSKQPEKETKEDDEEEEKEQDDKEEKEEEKEKESEEEVEEKGNTGRIPSKKGASTKKK